MDPQPDIVSVPSLNITPLTNGFTSFFTDNGINFWVFLKQLVGGFVGIAIPVSIFFLIAIVMTVEGLKRIRDLEEERYIKPPKQEEKHEKVDHELGKRWRTVLEHTESQNPNDWKQAIIEADIMLDQLLTKLGYRGESVGEKLKRVAKGDFKTLNQAWEAHKVRNRIAHDGSAFEINQLEAKETIGFYRQVFDEFYHISEK